MYAKKKKEFFCFDKFCKIKTWYEAVIMKVCNKKNMILVRYIGWGSDWDEWISINSDRLSGRYTKVMGPYTG